MTRKYDKINLKYKHKKGRSETNIHLQAFCLNVFFNTLINLRLKHFLLACSKEFGQCFRYHNRRRASRFGAWNFRFLNLSFLGWWFWNLCNNQNGIKKAMIDKDILPLIFNSCYTSVFYTI